MQNPEPDNRGLLRAFGSLLRKPEPSALPERVRATLRDADRASEILIGYVQLAVGFVLCLLFLISPRPADAAATMFAPVPLALAALLGFSVLRLWVILHGKAPGWFVVVSICADVGLLVGLIWSFHIQYGQPPAFSLKAPTFVYLFVFVVLRTLRFDPRYVLVAGIAAAAGWVLITTAAIFASPADAITRSFTEYVTANRILIGAEFDKIFALLLATGLLTLGALQAQRTLAAAVREETAVREIQRFLSRGVAEQITRSETLIEAGYAAERNAAIMMIDIRGFTRLAARVPPKDVVRMLTSFHARIIPVIRQRGGVVDKFLGDGVMATFGAVQSSATAAAECLGALEDVLDACETWQRSLREMGIAEPLQVNAAAAAGQVVFATLGDGDRLEYTVIGEAANLAAKLEKHNKVEKSSALTSQATFDLARRQGFEPARPVVQRLAASVAGVAEPIDLVGWTPAASEAQPAP